MQQRRRRVTRGAARRRRNRAADRSACSGWGMSPITVARLVADAGDAIDGAVRVPVDVHNRAQLWLGSRSGGAIVTWPSPCLTGQSESLTGRAARGERHIVAPRPSPASSRQTKRSTRCGKQDNAPGSRPRLAEQPWKPLQIPSTRPPAAASLQTAAVAGEKWRNRPHRGSRRDEKPSRQHHRRRGRQVAFFVLQTATHLGVERGERPDRRRGRPASPDMVMTPIRGCGLAQRSRPRPWRGLRVALLAILP